MAMDANEILTTLGIAIQEPEKVQCRATRWALIMADTIWLHLCWKASAT